jgi:hypothetical protein
LKRKFLISCLVFLAGCASDVAPGPKGPVTQEQRDLDTVCNWVKSLNELKPDQTYDFIFQKVEGGRNDDHYSDTYDSHLRIFGSCLDQRNFKISLEKTYFLGDSWGTSKQNTSLLIQQSAISYSGKGSRYQGDTKPWPYSVEVDRLTSGTALLSSVEIQEELVLSLKISGVVDSHCEQSIHGADGHYYGHSFGGKQMAYELNVILSPGGFHSRKEFSIIHSDGGAIFDGRHSTDTAGVIDTRQGLMNTNDHCM